ncbi:hypothetical protein DY000_02057608, partial [Brassica cretica]
MCMYFINKLDFHIFDFVIMERETHNGNGQHTIDIPNDEDFSSILSTDEETSDSGESNMGGATAHHEFYPPLTSDEGSSSCTIGWNSIEFVLTSVQIVAALVVWTLSKDEHPQGQLLAGLIVYTCGCITGTLLQSWRMYNQVEEYPNTRVDRVMEGVKTGLECFFVLWLIWGISWLSFDKSSPSDAPNLYRFNSQPYIIADADNILTELLVCLLTTWRNMHLKRMQEWNLLLEKRKSSHISKEEEAHNSSPKQTNKRRKRGSCEGNMIKQSKTLHGESESDESKRKHYPFATTHASKPLYRFKNTKLTLFVVLFLPLSKLLVRTEWENGVRQSTRIKSRPPEYWRGERFLYGRIHES